MCYCTPNVRTPFCHKCNGVMFLKIKEQQARIAELSEFIEARVPHEPCEGCTVCNLALGTDDLSALNNLKAKYEARIAELREAIVSVCCDPNGRVCISGSYGDRKVLQDALARTDDLSALEAVKAQAKREALLEAAGWFEIAGWDDVQRELRRMAGDVK